MPEGLRDSGSTRCIPEKLHERLDIAMWYRRDRKGSDLQETGREARRNITEELGRTGQSGHHPCVVDCWVVASHAEVVMAFICHGANCAVI
ncbi:hypothetical protein NEUTE2DRAFT_65108 [Neurospora tetrasperma FGSC 2509]|nr:hypothetical protein NEUTE2DRAFT_65108 [Neurospora tetrasperma FGSC 2509]